jgi:hypothetical protein
MWHIYPKLLFSPAPYVISFLKHLYNLLQIVWRSDWDCKSLWDGEHWNLYYVCAAYFLNLCNTNKKAMTNCMRLAHNIPETGLFCHLGDTQMGLILSWFLFVVKIWPTIPSQKLDLLPSSWKNRHYETYSIRPNGFNQPPPPTNNSTSSQSENNEKASHESVI